MHKMRDLYFSKNGDFETENEFPWFLSQLSYIGVMYLRKNDCLVEEIEYYTPRHFEKSVMHYSLFLKDDSLSGCYREICHEVPLYKLCEVLEDLQAINDYQRCYTVRF